MAMNEVIQIHDLISKLSTDLNKVYEVVHAKSYATTVAEKAIMSNAVNTDLIGIYTKAAAILTYMQSL